MAKSAPTRENTIDIVPLDQEEVTFCLLGITPFYCNRVAAKAKRELLLPRIGRMTPAQRAENLKHDPEAEFRDSPYLRRHDNGPTRIMMKATAIKGAIGQAALDTPSAVSKAQIDRLLYIVGRETDEGLHEEFIDIWGVPRLNMEVVRMADIGRTPDIRTRARIFPWAARVVVRFTRPMLTDTKVATLLSSAGMICGIGDFRQQKGKGSNGLFQMVGEDDPRYLRVLEAGGMAQQDEALANPECSDADSEELLAWYQEEILRRRQPAPRPVGGRGGGGRREAPVIVPHQPNGEATEAV
jgi:hypothetical protein